MRTMRNISGDMKRLKSNVIFNRALLWLILAKVTYTCEPHSKLLLAMELLVSAYNIWRSITLWEPQ